MRMHWKHTGGVLATWALGLSALAACVENNEVSDGDTHAPDSQDGDSDSSGDTSPSACDPGEALVGEVCRPCETGTWSDGAEGAQCLPKTDCEPGSYVLSEGGAVADRSCELCASGTTTTEVNQSSCEPSCSPGFVFDEAQGCQSCHPGNYCAGGAAPSVSCGADEWDDDVDAATPCVPLAVCEPGTYRTSIGSALTNTQCAPCEAGSYSDQPNAAACQPWSTCERHEIEVAPGSAFADRTCEDFEWVKGFGSIRQSQLYAVAVGPDGDVYIGGTFRAADTGLQNAVVRRYTPEGELVWEWFSSHQGQESVLSLAVNESQVVLVGESLDDPDNHPTGGALDGFVAALEREEGQLLWFNSLATPGVDKVRGVALGRLGDIYVTGHSDGMNTNQVDSLGKDNGFVRKYSSQGTMEWGRLVGTSEVDTLTAIRVAQEPEGDFVYVTGTTEGAFSPAPQADGVDVILAKYTDGGAQEWFKQIPITNAVGHSTLSQAVDGRICATYSALRQISPVMFEVHCYTAQGDIAVSKVFEDLNPDDFFGPKATLLAPDHTLWLVGDTYLNRTTSNPKILLSTYQLDSSLEVVEYRVFEEHVRMISLDASLSSEEPALYVIGYNLTEDFSDGEGLLYKLRQ